MQLVTLDSSSGTRRGVSSVWGKGKGISVFTGELWISRLPRRGKAGIRDYPLKLRVISLGKTIGKKEENEVNMVSRKCYFLVLQRSLNPLLTVRDKKTRKEKEREERPG